VGRAPRIEWPDGRRAAFSVFDDTDLITMQNGPPVYRALSDLGLFVTKSVWPVGPTGPTLVGGATCAEPDYLEWVLALQAEGHEIGFHNAVDHPSRRDETIHALDRFEELFGHAPVIGADHAGNVEALYWGPRRLSGVRSGAYDRAQKLMRPNRPSFSGHDPASPYFWGDVCRERITYWRNFCFNRTNLLEVSPKMPYHDGRRPYVNYWFTSTDGSNRARFLRHVTDEALDHLERSGGVCIMYTHFGDGFAPDGRLDPEVAAAFQRLARRDLWVAPASQVLDHLRAQLPDTQLTSAERRRIENRWVMDRVRDSSLLRRRDPKQMPVDGHQHR
jgi:hypothetical protein